MKTYFTVYSSKYNILIQLNKQGLDLISDINLNEPIIAQRLGALPKYTQMCIKYRNDIAYIIYPNWSEPGYLSGEVYLHTLENDLSMWNYLSCDIGTIQNMVQQGKTIITEHKHHPVAITV